MTLRTCPTPVKRVGRLAPSSCYLLLLRELNHAHAASPAEREPNPTAWNVGHDVAHHRAVGRNLQDFHFFGLRIECDHLSRSRLVVPEATIGTDRDPVRAGASGRR